MIVDFAAYVGHWWPGGELADGRPEMVKRRLQAAGIDAACVALLEGPWQRDQQAGNKRLAELVAPYRDFFLPLACLDPTTGYWREDLAHCVDELGMVGVRLYPAYHHYYLDDEAVVALAQEVGRRQLPLFVTLMIEEDRFAHPAIKIHPLVRPQPASQPRTALVISTALEERPLPPLTMLVRRAPETTFVITLATVEEAFSILRQPELAAGRVYFDVGRMDKPTLGLDYLVETIGAEQLLLGTNTPFFYPEGALLGLAYRRFADEISQKILSANYQANPVLQAAVATLVRR